MGKIGRNDPCPCGSGKKWKRCHGFQIVPAADVSLIADRAKAIQIQRERQQGLGRPIVSASHAGTRFVAVKNRLLGSKKWKTFHDFLGDYIKVALDPAWGNAEIKKSPELRHPVITWYQTISRQQQAYFQKQGTLYGMPLTGAAAAYLHLAYDLYALDHNAELQKRLLSRLKNHERFTGAYNEVQVAARFVRAGFDIAFEDETDSSTTHCEFTATYQKTGKRFAVEAKRREGHRPRIGRLFNDALAKRADHPRVIFIELNMRDDGSGSKQNPPAFFQSAVRRLRILEQERSKKGTAPEAYVFLTNTPWALCLEDPSPRSGCMAEGFMIPEFKEGHQFATLREIIDAREKHQEMHNLLLSMQDHSDVPATFDGEIPEFEFGGQRARLLIGRHYSVKDKDGIDRPARLTAATVSPGERCAHCAMDIVGGNTVLCKVPLTDAELEVWKRHPDTFFGVPAQRSMTAETPIELYDFFHAATKLRTKEQLLAALSESRDLDVAKLAELDQAQLASLHAERLTYGALAHR
jgi:hypothetical protein